MYITCPECSYDLNPKDAHFCEACGFELKSDPDKVVVEPDRSSENAHSNSIEYLTPPPPPTTKDISPNKKNPNTQNYPEPNYPELTIYSEASYPEPQKYPEPNYPELTIDSEAKYLEPQKYPEPTYPAATISSQSPKSPTQTARLIPKQVGSPLPEFILDSSNAIIGRFDPDTGPVEIDLDGFHGSETMSRKHGEIYMENGQWKIKDLGSTNGIFIKPAHMTRFGSRITTPQPLNSGDEIAIGKIRLLFQIP